MNLIVEEVGPSPKCPFSFLLILRRKGLHVVLLLQCSHSSRPSFSQQTKKKGGEGKVGRQSNKLSYYHVFLQSGQKWHVIEMSTQFIQFPLNDVFVCIYIYIYICGTVATISTIQRSNRAANNIHKVGIFDSWRRRWWWWLVNEYLRALLWTSQMYFDDFLNFRI